MRIAICITTFRRADGLRSLLTSLTLLHCGPGLSFDVIVVDNDAAESALSVVHGIVPKLNYQVACVVEAKRGLTYARNTALELGIDEIQVNGPNVGVGYWGRPAADGVFGLPPIDPESGAGWLATGDLGVRYDGELFMTGRLKDLVIVDGRNHYPQDIEQTVEIHPAVRPHSAAVFAIEREDGEAAVVLAERAKGSETDLVVATGEIRRAVSAAHGLRPYDVVFLAPGEIPRTSSGKISRARCRKSYLDGSLTVRRLG